MKQAGLLGRKENHGKTIKENAGSFYEYLLPVGLQQWSNQAGIIR